jgi:peptidyl-prolyl isomerase D
MHRHASPGWEARHLWRSHSRQVHWYVIFFFFLYVPGPPDLLFSVPHRKSFLTVRRVENYSTSSGDVPSDPIVITDSGELEPSDPSLTEPVVASDGDPYEDYPDDDHRNTQDPAVALEAARLLRELGTARWKEGLAADALDKWQKALRYLNVHPVLPDDAPPEITDEFNALRTPLLLNSALAAFRSPGGLQGANIALKETSTALRLPKLSDTDRGA